LKKIDIRALPKISLHDHLDGGLRPQTIIELADAVGHQLPSQDAASLGRWFAESANSGSLPRYLQTFDHTTAVMQTREALTRVAKEFVFDLAADGVVYAEVRYAPEQHLKRGLTLDEVVEAVQDGLEQGMEAIDASGGFIRTGQLITAMRHADRALEIAELAVRHRDNGVVGFDIAGAEEGFPPIKHKLAFDYLANELMPTTVHAGEADGIDSIKDAIVNGRALRLGHGVRVCEDLLVARTEGGADSVVLGPVAQWIHDREIPLELCVSSNLQTGASREFGDTFEEHPFDLLYGLGFKVTVNTDNRLMSATTLTRELELMVEAWDYDLEDIRQFQLNAAESVFQGALEREDLIDLINDAFDECLED
jgi:adenosine deaminase